MTARDALAAIRERAEDTTGWLEWISPRATTKIAVVYADGDVYLPTGGTAEEFAFANARGNVHPLMRKDGVPALVGALEAVLEEHVRRGGLGIGCRECGQVYPCSTVRAIETVLEGR